MERKKLVTRGIIYLLAMVCLAFGLTMNVQTGLGVSPIVSVAYSTSAVLHLNFANTTFMLYTVFVIVEIIIHLSIHRSDKSLLVKDLLQLPLSLVFTRFMALFQFVIPQLSSYHMAIRLIALVIAIIATGVGAAASLSMKIVPNPGDGIVQALADLFNHSVGFMKNVFDGFNVMLCLLIGLAGSNRVIGIGIGTLIAFIGVGRVIALFNKLFGEKLKEAAGL